MRRPADNSPAKEFSWLSGVLDLQNCCRVVSSDSILLLAGRAEPIGLVGGRAWQEDHLPVPRSWRCRSGQKRKGILRLRAETTSRKWGPNVGVEILSTVSDERLDREAIEEAIRRNTRSGAGKCVGSGRRRGGGLLRVFFCFPDQTLDDFLRSRTITPSAQ